MPVKRNPAARREKLKADAAIVYREKLSFAKTLASIIRLENKLEKFEDTQSLVAVLNSKWKRMNKLMPDLKAIESSGNNTLEVHITRSYD